jgi:hypothetical protein
MCAIPSAIDSGSLACLFICPGAKKSSIRISHIKKVQQQNLPHQKRPAVKCPTSSLAAISPTAEKPSSRKAKLNCFIKNTIIRNSTGKSMSEKLILASDI